MGFAAHTITAAYQKMSVHLRINRFFRSLIETFFEREKDIYLKKCLKMPLSKHYKSGNSPLGHLHSWSRDAKFGTEIWSHNVCICYLCWRDTSIQGTLASGPEGFPSIEVVLCAFLTERIPRVSLECRGSIVCAFDRTYKSVSKTNDRGASLDRRHCS